MSNQLSPEERFFEILEKHNYIKEREIRFADYSCRFLLSLRNSNTIRCLIIIVNSFCKSIDFWIKGYLFEAVITDEEEFHYFKNYISSCDNDKNYVKEKLIYIIKTYSSSIISINQQKKLIFFKICYNNEYLIL